MPNSSLLHAGTTSLFIALLITSPIHSQDNELPPTVVESASPGQRPSPPVRKPVAPTPVVPAPIVEPLVLDDEELTANVALSESVANLVEPFDTVGIEDTREILRYAPNFSFTDGGARGYGEVVAVRGLTNTSFFGPSPIALYVDDVPFGETFTQAWETGPLESVGVFPGPQPTRVGRSAYGGLIDVRTRRPTARTEGALTYERGSYDAQRLDGWVASPLPENVGSVRLRAVHDERDGFLINPTLGGERVDFLESRNLDGAIFLNLAPDWELGFLFGVGTQRDGSLRATSLDRTTGFYTVNSDVPGEQLRDMDYQALRIAHEGETMKFLSVTSRRNYELLPSRNDLDLTALPLVVADLTQTQEVWSQEFRFSDNDPEAVWGWRAGLYGSSGAIDGRVVRDLIQTDSRVDRFVTTVNQPIPFPPIVIPLTVRSTAVSDTAASISQDTRHSIDEESFAAYGELEYRGFERATLRIGGRIDRVERSIVRNLTRTGEAVTQTTITNTIDPILGFPPFPAPPAQNVTTVTPLDAVRPEIAMQREWVHFTPTAGVDFELGNGFEAYANASYAFKPGGFSPYTNDPDLVAFDEETAFAKEAGLRFADPNGRTVANLAFFHSKVEDYQVERSVTPLDYTVFNADEAEVYGAEFQIVHEISPSLDFLGSIGWTHARLTRYRDPVTGQNLDGVTPPNVPEFDAVAALDYHLENGFFVRAELVALGNVMFDDFNRPEFQQDAYVLCNGMCGYRKGQWTASVYGSNLGGKEYYAQMSPEVRSGSPGAPREAGIRVGFEF